MKAIKQQSLGKLGSKELTTSVLELGQEGIDELHERMKKLVAEGEDGKDNESANA